MNNFLDNGTILPHGLLGENLDSAMAGFNKSYRNFPLRIGIIIAAYPVGDPSNRYGLTTEYDVYVIEQNEDKGVTPIRYKNCMSSEGLGSIADYFEKSLRIMTQNSNKGSGINLKGQNGAIVLLLCLDAMSDKGIIISSLTHPNRQTNLSSKSPYLEGEYNGVNVVVNTDGSTVLTFKGATDNSGNPLDSSQGNTVFQIKSDGSFEFNHDTIDISANRSGVLNITTKSDCIIKAEGNLSATCQQANITSSGDASVTSSGTTTVEGTNVKLGKDASHAVLKGDLFKTYFSSHTHPTVMGPSGPPTQPFTPDLLSTKVNTE